MLARSLHAKQFILSMWDQDSGKFWTGTLDDGITPNKSVIPVDIQAWALLALREDAGKYLAALSFAESHLKTSNGFDFNEDRDGTWYEGTAQMASAYFAMGRCKQSDELIKFLSSVQDSSGGMLAADVDGLTTGFDWQYFKRLHVGATAWMILAQEGVNPFWPQEIHRRMPGSASSASGYVFYPNFPNPFNQLTVFQYALPHPVKVSIRLFDVLGRQIRTLVEENQETGNKCVEWEATDDDNRPISSGAYFYRVEIVDSDDPGDRLSRVGKVILLK